ncbi:unnamed protein product [Callosobruchus maculatus]|nr:unnamed protein product [Callosobruchus maculatus]
MSDNEENPNKNACEENEAKQDGTEDDTDKITRSRTPRSILDVPLRTNVSADGQEEEQFK